MPKPVSMNATSTMDAKRERMILPNSMGLPFQSFGGA